jgi:hypothetical protein
MNLRKYHYVAGLQHNDSLDIKTMHTRSMYRDYAIVSYISIYEPVDVYEYARLNKIRMPKLKRPHAAIPS